MCHRVGRSPGHVTILMVACRLDSFPGREPGWTLLTSTSRPMIKFGIYVDGSVLIGSLNKHELKVEDFEAFYRYIFEEAAKAWGSSFLDRQPPPGCHLHRVYWYQVAGIDRIDFADSKTQNHYRALFDAEESLNRLYIALAGQHLKSGTRQEIENEAFRIFFEEKREWYASKASMLDAMRSFNHAIQAGCDFIEIISCGYWKVNLIGGQIMEKGLETAFAVDIAHGVNMVDVIVIIAGDYDAIPVVAYAKDHGRNVGIFDIHRGASTDAHPRLQSSRLHNLCDFVCPVYEADLVARKIATSRGRHGAAGGSGSSKNRPR